MKIAPLLRAFGETRPRWPTVLVHTGQHYDADLNDRQFSDLRLPTPDYNLEVGSSTHAVQTAEVMLRFEPVVDRYRPACVLVVGDVNSTLACTLVAVKKGIPVAHVEAGLRSFDRAMPEEINRLLTDQVADLLYTTEPSGRENLLREGVAQDRIRFVGNVMIDNVLANRALAVAPTQSLAKAGIDAAAFSSRYAVVTLHRPSNVDDASTLRGLVGVVREVAQRIPVVFTLHPRTRESLRQHGIGDELQEPRIALLPPLSYLQMLGLVESATLVLTDSGGLQEETTALGIPCLTLRDTTERPITVEAGTNTVVGRDRELILRHVDEILSGGGKRGRVPELWDGQAATRIASDLTQWLAARRQQVEV
jgi:UDP-N-acetylglucosamine 2-epimerase (non-hydrolysing)